MPALAAMLKDPLENNRMQAIQVLRQVAPQCPEDAAPVLVEAMKGKSTVVRSQAAQVLGLLGAGAEGAVPALAEMLADPLPANRIQAALTLGQLGPAAESAAPALAEALRDKDYSVRSQPAQALGRLGPQTLAGLSRPLK